MSNKKNTQDKLKLLQKLELENLDLLIKICKENNLRYYLIGGSLIGVMRHKGFIPWDDDIDIGIPRKDYNHFVDIAKSYIPDYMDIKTMSSEPDYKCYFTRLINNKKKIYWNHGQYIAKIGIWMDVFPLDGLPENVLMRNWQVFVVYFWKALYKFTQIDYVSTNKKRGFIECFLIKFAQITKIGKLFSAESMMKHLDQRLQKYDYDKEKYVWNFSGCYGKREIVSKLQLGGKRKGLFEGRIVSIPLKAEDYLTNIYGNYMKLPPVKERISHEIIFADEKE